MQVWGLGGEGLLNHRADRARGQSLDIDRSRRNTTEDIEPKTPTWNPGPGTPATAPALDPRRRNVTFELYHLWGIHGRMGSRSSIFNM